MKLKIKLEWENPIDECGHPIEEDLECHLFKYGDFKFYIMDRGDGFRLYIGCSCEDNYYLFYDPHSLLYTAQTQDEAKQKAIEYLEQMIMEHIEE